MRIHIGWDGIDIEWNHAPRVNIDRSTIGAGDEVLILKGPHAGERGKLIMDSTSMLGEYCVCVHGEYPSGTLTWHRRRNIMKIGDHRRKC